MWRTIAHPHLYNVSWQVDLIKPDPMLCRAWALASLAPSKDMEVVVIGSGLECADFQLLLYVGLRALVDKLGAATFNVGIFNISLDASGKESTEAAPLLARCLSTPPTVAPHWQTASVQQSEACICRMCCA